MSRLVENKSVVAVVFVLFALVGAAKAIQGAGVAVPGHMPSDPWDGSVTIANGPILEPDPWDGNLSVTA